MATKNKTNSLISNLGIGKPKATENMVVETPAETAPEVRPSTENTTPILNTELYIAMSVLSTIDYNPLRNQLKQVVDSRKIELGYTSCEIPVFLLLTLVIMRLKNSGREYFYVVIQTNIM